MKLSFLILVLLLTACGQSPSEDAGMSLSEALGGLDTAGYERAEEVRQFVFPQDHGSHEGFRNEWWYVTGNVKDADGHRFGFQVTFFRISTAPQDGVGAVTVWDSNQLWMVHVAVSDIDGGQHYHDRRLVRQAAGLAGQQFNPFRIWAEDWSIEGRSDGAFPWTIDLGNKEFHLQLTVSPLKPHMLQGDRGLSQKGKELGNASYYYSFPRLGVAGSIRVNGKKSVVDGLGWLDREWSTSALDDDQVGWDWFSLQFNDHRDLMFYRLRTNDGGVSATTEGSVSDSKGIKLRLASADVDLQALRHWTSASGRRYPVEWRMKVEGMKTFVVEALLDSQEMSGPVVYWEGAVSIRDEETSEHLGYGYLEMTGY